MRQSGLGRRSLATLLTALLVFALGGQATGVRPCPHHGSPDPGSAPAVAHDGTGSRADTGGAATDRAGETSGGASDDGPLRPCTCFGTCHVGATAVAPTAATLPLPASPGPRATNASPSVVPLPPAREPGFLLHLPNAPPA